MVKTINLPNQIQRLSKAEHFRLKSCCILVSWLPANVKFWQPILAGPKDCQPPFENKQTIIGWANGKVSHQGRVNNQSVAELKICAAIKKKMQIIKNSCQPQICIISIWEWMTQTATKLKYTNNKRLNWKFETFSDLQGNKLWTEQPNRDSPTATAGLKEKFYHSGQKISQPISSQKHLVTSQQIFFLALVSGKTIALIL